eukprot:13901742-Ditylum_brightwellii.AAC.1
MMEHVDTGIFIRTESLVKMNHQNMSICRSTKGRDKTKIVMLNHCYLVPQQIFKEGHDFFGVT